MMKFKFLLSVLIIYGFISCTTKSSGIVPPTNTDSTSNKGVWVQKTTLTGMPRDYAISFNINNYAYVGTGIGYTVIAGDTILSVLSDFWKYDATTSSWSQVSSMPVGRGEAIAFSIDGNGYVGTGTDSYGTYYNDFYQYNPTSNTWTKKADFPGAARSGATAFAIGDNGYVTCGWDGNYYKDMYSYNATNNTWKQEVSLGGDKRLGAMSFVYNNMGYVVGGTNSGGQAAVDFWRYDPAIANWTQLSDISNTNGASFDDNYTDIARTNGVAFVIDSTAYLTTGQSIDGGAYISSTWAYNIKQDLWQKIAPFTGGSIYGGVGFVLNGEAFIGTGRNSSTGSSSDAIYQFYPDSTAK